MKGSIPELLSDNHQAQQGVLPRHFYVGWGISNRRELQGLDGLTWLVISQSDFLRIATRVLCKSNSPHRRRLTLQVKPLDSGPATSSLFLLYTLPLSTRLGGRVGGLCAYMR